MLTLDDYGAIRTARRDGRSIRTIARELGHSRNTVRKILKHPERDPVPSFRIRLSPVTGPFLPIIDQILGEDKESLLERRKSAMDMYRRLCDEHGYRGSYAPIQRYVLKQRRREQALASHLSESHRPVFQQARAGLANGQAPVLRRIDRSGAVPLGRSEPAIGNFIDNLIVVKIHTLYEAGWSQRRIARALIINRETVARCLQHADPHIKTDRASLRSTSMDGASNPPATVELCGGGGQNLGTCRSHSDWLLAVLQGKESLETIQSGGADSGAFDSLIKNVRNGNLKARNKAVCVLAKVHGIPSLTICKFLHIARSTVKNYWKTYRTFGCDRLFDGFYDKKLKSANESLRNHVFSVLHTPPSAYDINRTTWKMADLRRILSENGHPVSAHVLRRIIRDAGYQWRVARKVLTSNDPNYREKLAKIQSILSTLGPKERFFSIDEYGPFAVKMQGGRSLMPPGTVRTVPQHQRSKGRLILTAALELSTNQVTHFYSEKKNTAEMIKLLEVLLVEYSDCDKIYFSWDAASWHASKALNKRVDEINSQEYKAEHRCPLVALVPLPSCAQFLNVIESVFSGMARAVIHNSDYESVDACKAAIDRHFAERNTFFRANPKRAGGMIWGKENVPSQFSPSNNCKDPKHSFFGL
jgi:transposase